MRALLLALGLLAVAPAAYAADCAPAKMVRIVTRNVTPGVPAGFPREPLVMYRQGTQYLRSEEAPDPPQGLHLLSVIAEPDVWFVNRMDRTGRHIVDRQPPLEVHAPIISGEGVAQAFSELEFGCEAEFVRARALSPQGRRKVEGRDVAVHALVQGGERLEVLLDARGRPAEAGYYRDGKPILIVRYDAFEPGLPFDPKLFARPEGITYTEAEPEPGTPPLADDGRPAV